MRRLAITAAIAAAVATLGLAVGRIEIDANVFSLLPRDSSAVRNLELQQRLFGAPNELVLLLHGEQPAAVELAAERLAGDLAGANLGADVQWRHPTLRDPETLGSLLAYLWFNQPPEALRQLPERFGSNRAAVLQRSLEMMATSFRPDDVARIGADPFRLGDIQEVLDSPVAAPQSDPFASADGRHRLVLLTTPEPNASFLESATWLSDVENWLANWVAQQPDGDRLTVSITGNQALVAQAGTGLLRDVELAALGTLICVALLFGIAYRRARPLLALGSILAAVMATTAIAGAHVFDALHVASFGFAAILLGLASDYGLILYQERIDHPHASLKELWAPTAPAILWSAVTTAGAFLMIARSSLPGLTQLGVLVAIGIVTAAIVMLSVFPPLAGRPARPTSNRRSPVAFRLGGRAAATLTVLLVAASAIVLVFERPQVERDASSLGPADIEAREVLEELQGAFGQDGRDVWLVISGVEEDDVATQLRHARNVLSAARRDGDIASFELPDAGWPEVDRQSTNRATIEQLSAHRGAARDAALAAGFTAESLVLTEAAFSAWRQFSESSEVVWPRHPELVRLFRQFAAYHDDGVAALGRIQFASDTQHAAVDSLARRLTEAEAGTLVGWSLLADALLVAMQQDVQRVLAPMAVVLLGLLALAFRRVAEVCASVAVITVSVAALLAVMALAGWSWNLMNVMAIPMLLGAGVDYGLHVQFAMRRSSGNAVRVRNTVGRAILLCSVSTAAGFASLAFAGNAGLASLGRVAACGIVIMGLVAVFLLPAWWQWTARQPKTAP